MTQDLLTASQAARELGITRSRLHQIIRAGGIVAARIGEGSRAPWTITRTELDAYRLRRALVLNEQLRKLGGQ